MTQTTIEKFVFFGRKGKRRKDRVLQQIKAVSNARTEIKPVYNELIMFPTLR